MMLLTLFGVVVFVALLGLVFGWCAALGKQMRFKFKISHLHRKD